MPVCLAKFKSTEYTPQYCRCRKVSSGWEPHSFWSEEPQTETVSPVRSTTSVIPRVTTSSLQQCSSRAPTGPTPSPFWTDSPSRHFGRETVFPERPSAVPNKSPVSLLPEPAAKRASELTESDGESEVSISFDTTSDSDSTTLDRIWARIIASSCNRT